MCGHLIGGGGRCCRKVAAPGAPCGVNHAAGGAGPALGGLVAAAPGPDPFAGASDDLDARVRRLAADSQVCHHCGEPVEQDTSPGVYVHARDLDGTHDLDEDHNIVPVTDIDEADSVMVKRWFTRRRRSHPDWYHHAAAFPSEYDEWFDEIDQGGHPAEWSADPAELDVYADHPNWRVNQATATNPHTAAATLSRLTTHPNPEVRAAAAANPSCPPADRAHVGLLAD